MRLVYLALRALAGAQHFLRERLTKAGWLVLGAAAVAAAVGVDTTRTMSFQAFTLLVALLAVAFVAAPFFRARVAVHRELPRYATAGEPCEYRVSVENRGARSLEGVTLVEGVRDPRPAYDEWRRTREPGERRRNWFDRNAGYFRWRWLIERRTPRPPRDVGLPALAPGARTSVKLALTPRRRGRIELDGLVLARPDPLGLVKGLVRAAAPARLMALPKRYRLPRLELPGARRFQQGGVALASSIGDSAEFVSLRDYRPGDPLQRVHWKSFARTGKPVVKEYQDEFFERHALVLDTSTDRGEDAAFEEAVALAASFVYAIDTHECLLDLLFVGGEVHRYTTGRGQMPAEQLLEVLAGLAPSGPEAFESLADAVRAHRHRLTSCIVLLLAWDEPRRAFVESLRRSGLEVRALLVCAPGDAPPEDAPAGRPAGLVVLRAGEIEAGIAGFR
jgi:uncharacterized protein (DUF58 family)